MPKVFVNNNEAQENRKYVLNYANFYKNQIYSVITKS